MTRRCVAPGAFRARRGGSPPQKRRSLPQTCPGAGPARKGARSCPPAGFQAARGHQAGELHAQAPPGCCARTGLVSVKQATKPPLRQASRPETCSSDAAGGRLAHRQRIRPVALCICSAGDLPIQMYCPCQVLHPWVACTERLIFAPPNFHQPKSGFAELYIKWETC